MRPYLDSISHLTDVETDYFRRWEHLVVLEEQESRTAQKCVWMSSSASREKEGHCFASMVLTSEDNGNGDGEDGEREPGGSCQGCGRENSSHNNNNTNNWNNNNNNNNSSTSSSSSSSLSGQFFYSFRQHPDKTDGPTSLLDLRMSKGDFVGKSLHPEPFLRLVCVCVVTICRRHIIHVVCMSSCFLMYNTPSCVHSIHHLPARVTHFRARAHTHTQTHTTHTYTHTHVTVHMHTHSYSQYTHPHPYCTPQYSVRSVAIMVSLEVSSTASHRMRSEFECRQN